jgi:hypothetical protein
MDTLEQEKLAELNKNITKFQSEGRSFITEFKSYECL